MPVPELTLLIAGAVVAGFVQGLAGFGFSMVAMSFWVWGLAPPLAAAMAVFGSLVGQLIAIAAVPRQWSFALLAPFLLGGLAGIPLGVWALPHLDPLWFKAILGALLVLVCPAMLMAARLPRVVLRSPAAARLADGLAGAAGGVMGGLGGFTGVVPSLWCTLRGFDKGQQRGVIQNFNLATLSVTMAAYIATGALTQAMWPLLPLVALALAVPSLLGARVYRHLSDARFRQVVLGLLTLSGFAMLATSVPRLAT